MHIDKILVHHAGGLGTDNSASTQHLTVKNIDDAHRQRWPDFRSALGYWVGYSFVIEKDGKVTQTRLIGEETAHTIGQNKSSVGILVMGNFERGVDTPTTAQVVSLKKLLKQIKSTPEEFKTAMGTTTISITGVYPHRKFANTSCYGNSLLDTWASDMGTEDVTVSEDIVALLQKLVLLLTELLARKDKTLGAADGPILDCAERG